MKNQYIKRKGLISLFNVLIAFVGFQICLNMTISYLLLDFKVLFFVHAIFLLIITYLMAYFGGIFIACLNKLITGWINDSTN